MQFDGNIRANRAKKVLFEVGAKNGEAGAWEGAFRHIQRLTIGRVGRVTPRLAYVKEANSNDSSPDVGGGRRTLIRILTVRSN